MHATLKQIQIVLQAPIGLLTDMRRQKLAEINRQPFLMGNIDQLPNAVAFIRPPDGPAMPPSELVIVNEAQIDYRREGEQVSSDLTEASELLNDIRQTLLLDDSFTAIIQVVAHLQVNHPSTELSVEHFTSMTNEELRRRFAAGLRGVGLRFTFEQAPYTSDLHIEPFFADPSVFFLRLGSAVQNPLSLSAITRDAMEQTNYLTNEAVTLVRNLMGEE